MEELDYEELLKKYIQHVKDVSGSDFITNINDPISDVDFSVDEVKALLKASENNY